MKAPLTSTTASLVATLDAGVAWPGGVITFSIPTAGSPWTGYAAGEEPFLPGYATANATIAAQIRLAMQGWDELIAPSLREVSEPASPGNIRLAFTDMLGSGSWGYASLRWQATTIITADIWIDTDQRSESFAAETYDFQALQHEIGHALGLKHPFQAPNLLPVATDTHRYSLMSYTEVQDRYVYGFEVTQTSPNSSRIQATPTAVIMAGPQLLDVLAIQAKYGADRTTRASDTTYSFDPARASVQTIYDAGGTDIWDLSGSTRRSLIDLREGAFSSVNQFSVAGQIEASVASVGETWRGFVTSVLSGDSTFTWDNNVSIAYGTIIENLRLGSGGDQAIGNAARNALSGNDGNDTLLGEGGQDSLDGGTGDDSLAGGAGDDTITGGTGADVAAFAGARAEYTVTRHVGTGIVTVRDNTANRDGTDSLQADVETLRFSDTDYLASSFPSPVAVLSISALSADKAEGNAGSTPFTFLVTRAEDSAGSASATWSVTGNGATAADLIGNALPSGTVSFAPGETSQTITVNVAGDTTNEGHEGFTVTLSAPTGGTLGTASASGTIRDDDTPSSLPVLSITPLLADRAEGNLGSTAFTFIINRTGPLEGISRTVYEVAGAGSSPATQWADLESSGGEVTFLAGEDSKTITVSIKTDLVPEPDETFTVTLLDPFPFLGLRAGATFGTATATGTIRNDDLAATIGADTVIGTMGDDGISGLAGNDLLDGGDGNDVIFGGDGNDTIMAGSGNDTLQGGAGLDTALYGAAFDAIDLSISLTRFNQALGLYGPGLKGALGQDFFFGVENLIGAAGNDQFIGDEQGNLLTGNGGNDSLDGASGQDSLLGGAGDDTLVGGWGNDFLTGGLGADRFEVSDGTDRISDLGLGGADVVRVGGEFLPATVLATLAANWTATAVTVNDSALVITAAGFHLDLGLMGGINGATATNAGNTTGVRMAGSIRQDVLTGGEGRDTLLGGAGGDTLSGNGGDDSLSGGADNDSLNGGAGNDTLLGEADNDSLTGGAGDDRLTGGLGVDRFGVDAGTDTITDLGLGGADALLVSAGATANATLAANWILTIGNSNNGTANITAAGFNADLTLAAGSAGWVVSNLGTARAVTLTGSARNDRLTGGNGNDTLNGGGGNDSLLGEAGNDSLTGGTGNDSMTGGAGVDRFVVDAGTDTITDLATGGNDLVIVSAGAIANATLAGAWTASGNVANAGQANIAAGGFGVNLSAATGAATGLWSVTNAGQAAAVIFTGSGLRDRLTGGLGNDSLTGNAGDDTLTGGSGHDTLIGGAGVDSLVGGAGDDRLTGGLDVDRFLVESGMDTITDLGFGGTDALIIQAGATANATIGGHWTASAGTSNAGSANLAAAGFNVDLASVTGSSGWALSNAHARGVRLVGSGRADTITGGSGADTLRGQAGADSLSGGDGNDQLLGGAGNDTMTGGAGIDRFTVDAGVDVITDFGEAGVDILNISAGATALVTMRADWLATDASSNLGVANLVAAGFDVNLQAVRGTAGWNVTNAGDANDVALNGSTRNDALTGGGGADWLRGGLGNDTLDGGAGADTVHGGYGTDRLTGGSGADLFVFLDTYQLWGDVITDFDAAEGDRLDLRQVDADRTLEERQLEFIGSNPFLFEGQPIGLGRWGAMRFEDGWLQFDVNVDGVADIQMQLLGVTTLNAEDMWL